MTITIRAMGEADRPAVEALLQLLNLYEHGFSGDRRIDPAAGAAATDATLAAIARDGGAALVAAARAGVVGVLLMHYRTAPAYVAVGQAREAWISELCVAPPYRRQGVGQMLLRDAEAIARRDGRQRLLIGALAGNHGALAAYRRYGFKDYMIDLIKPL